MNWWCFFAAALLVLDAAAYFVFRRILYWQDEGVKNLTSLVLN